MESYISWFILVREAALTYVAET